MDISEIDEDRLYVASKFYPIDTNVIPGALFLDCSTFLVDDDVTFQDRVISSAAYFVRDVLNRTPVVLICDAGRNRSCVVAAKVLILQGGSPSDVIEHVRECRSHLRGGALTNHAFVEFLAPT